MDGGAYGAGKAGQGYDPQRILKKPQVILRLVSLVSLLCSLYRVYPAVPIHDLVELCEPMKVIDCFNSYRRHIG